MGAPDATNFITKPIPYHRLQRHLMLVQNPFTWVRSTAYENLRRAPKFRTKHTHSWSIVAQIRSILMTAWPRDVTVTVETRQYDAGHGSKYDSTDEGRLCSASVVFTVANYSARYLRGYNVRYRNSPICPQNGALFSYDHMKVFGPKWDEVARHWRSLHIEGDVKLWTSPTPIRLIR
jgi:hypothetical protein